MCIEDVKIGQAKDFGTFKLVTASANTVLPQNPSRVGIIVSCLGVMYYDAAGGAPVVDQFQLFFGTSLSGPPVMQWVGNLNPFTLTIEKHGRRLQGDISISIVNQSTIAQVSLIEIVLPFPVPPYKG